jgi:3-hydroxybutyryl-CoA dehydratase
MKKPRNFEPIKPGDSASLSLTVLQSVVEGFGEVVGDKNPIHFDDAFAKTTRFGRRIAHGMLSASLISAVIGNELPGPGSIYISQTLEFTSPVYLGDELTAKVTVVAVRQDKPIATLETICSNQDGAVVVKGEAVVAYARSSK